MLINSLCFTLPPSHQRLQSKIIKLVDVSYGGENGFNQAIELAAESLQNVKFIQEKKLIGRYFDEISQVRIAHRLRDTNETKKKTIRLWRDVTRVNGI